MHWIYVYDNEFNLSCANTYKAEDKKVICEWVEMNAKSTELELRECSPHNEWEREATAAAKVHLPSENEKT